MTSYQLLIPARFHMPRPNGQFRVNLLGIVLVEIYILDRANASRIGHGPDKSNRAVSRVEREFTDRGAVAKAVSSHDAWLARRNSLVDILAPAVSRVELVLELNLARVWIDNAI